MSLGTGNYAVLRAPSSICVFGMESGRELRQRTFASGIEGLMRDTEHV